MTNQELMKLKQFFNLEDASKKKDDLLGKLDNTIRPVKPFVGMAKIGSIAAGDALANSLGVDNAAQITQALSAAYLGTMTPQKSRDVNNSQKEAALNKQIAHQSGYSGNQTIDSLGSGSRAIKNAGNFLKTGYLLNAAGVSNPIGSLFGNTGFAMGPAGGGIAAMKMAGGLEQLGGATTGALGSGLNMLGLEGASAMMGGINPMVAGLGALVAASKGSKALYNKFQEGSSINLKKDKLSTTTQFTSPHQLEKDYGSTDNIRRRIKMLQEMNVLQPGDALLADILGMIEGHTSVLPMLTSTIIDNESVKNKEGGNGAQNTLDELFGSDGANDFYDQQNKKKTGKFFQFLSALELGTSNLNATFDIFGQIGNTLQGKSSTKLYNEANTKAKLQNPFAAEQEFGSQFKIPTSMVKAIHTTPSQIIDTNATYEGKLLSLIGLGVEINKFSAHELLNIRTNGFGLSNVGSHGLLRDIKDRIEFEEQEAEINSFTMGKQALRNIDELLGYLPGWNMVSGSIKMINSASDYLGDTIDSLSKSDTINPFKAFFNNLYDSMGNDALNDPNSLLRAIGATEMDAQQRMATYLGYDFPDRFELLLKYNLSQMESLEAMAGPVHRSQLETLTMNKFTGRMMNDAGHQNHLFDLFENLENQLDFIKGPTSFFQQLFYDEDSVKARQRRKFKKDQQFLMNKGGYDIYSRLNDISSDISDNISDNDSVSAQDIQDRVKRETDYQYRISLEERKIFLLEEILTCLGCESKSKRINKPQQDQQDQQESQEGDTYAMMGGLGGGRDGKNKRSKSPTKGKGKLAGARKLIESVKGFFKKGMFGKAAGLMGRVIGFLLPGLATPMAPFIGTAIAAASALYMAYELYDYVTNDKVSDIDVIDSKVSDKDKERVDANRQRLELLAGQYSNDQKQLVNYLKQNYTAEQLEYMIADLDSDFYTSSNEAKLMSAAKQALKEKGSINSLTPKNISKKPSAFSHKRNLTKSFIDELAYKDVSVIDRLLNEDDAFKGEKNKGNRELLESFKLFVQNIDPSITGEARVKLQQEFLQSGGLKNSLNVAKKESNLAWANFGLSVQGKSVTYDTYPGQAISSLGNGTISENSTTLNIFDSNNNLTVIYSGITSDLKVGTNVAKGSIIGYATGESITVRVKGPQSEYSPEEYLNSREASYEQQKYNATHNRSSMHRSTQAELTEFKNISKLNQQINQKEQLMDKMELARLEALSKGDDRKAKALEDTINKQKELMEQLVATFIEVSGVNTQTSAAIVNQVQQLTKDPSKLVDLHELLRSSTDISN